MPPYGFLAVANLALAKKQVAESGCNNEPIVPMSPSDQAQLVAMAQVTDALFQSLGLNSQYTSMDWGGLALSNAGSNYPLRGNGNGGWFGWPTDPAMEALRDKWFDAPDLVARKGVCPDMQALAFQNLPFFPAGQWFIRTAHRADLTGFVRAGFMLFWGVKRI